MKNVLLVVGCLFSAISYSQDRPQRGPYNTLPNGVKDGPVIKEEVPVRQVVQPEYIREADMVWSKRVFSRIDAREKINHDIFLPYDYFDGDLASGSSYRPSSPNEIDDPTWNKDQRRWSLWTIMLRHIMLGDLTVYRVSSEFYPDVEDGHLFKYPIAHQGQNDYFEVKKYRNDVNALVTSGGIGPKLRIYRPVSEDTMDIVKTSQTLTAFLDSLRSDPDYEDLFGIEPTKLQGWWDFASENSPVRKDGITMYIPSNNIVAYNVKEDWYFDKERSMFESRIIGIAPVARYTYEEPEEGEQPTRGELLVYDQTGKPFLFSSTANTFEEYEGRVEEREMFWIYFDELRNVIVNYYVYNDKNDSQWMSMDDLFWKRKFIATIYKTSEKFDREIQDYKYGVDALYEAERIKEDMRKWEHDLWHF